MVGYFGSEAQKRLQKRAEDVLARSQDTPGYSNAGRLVGVDDVDAVGWPAIFEELEESGAVVLRLLPSERASEVERRISEAGYRVDFYDVFVGNVAETAAAFAADVPDGLRHLAAPARGDDPLVERAQAFMHANGIVPFSGSMLTGELPKSRLFILVDEGGEIAATSYAYLPHNAFSPFHSYAWAGLIAVSPTMRGRNVGRYVSACAVAAAFEELGAEAVYALVDGANVASRKMVEACGLRFDPRFKTGAVVAGKERFTR